MDIHTAINITKPKNHYFCEVTMNAMKNNLTPNFKPPTFLTDYYPFGYPIAERSSSSNAYRFGFNGQEKDDEIYGEGASLSFEFRNYDSRLGRFWSVDPLYIKYPFLSPYVFVANSPLMFIDLTGGYYIKPPSKDYNRYRIMVTNYRWVNNVSKWSATPALGYLYEAMLALQRAKDPSYNLARNEVVGFGLQAFGAGSLKFISKIGKIGNLNRFILNTNRQIVSSTYAAFSEPETKEIALEYLAIKSLEEESKGKVYGEGSNSKNVKEFTFVFNEYYVKNIENEISANNPNFTTEELKDAVTNKLNTVMEDKKNEIKKSLEEDNKKDE